MLFALTCRWEKNRIEQIIVVVDIRRAVDYPQCEDIPQNYTYNETHSCGHLRLIKHIVGYIRQRNTWTTGNAPTHSTIYGQHGRSRAIIPTAVFSNVVVHLTYQQLDSNRSIRQYRITTVVRCSLAVLAAAFFRQKLRVPLRHTNANQNKHLRVVGNQCLQRTGRQYLVFG